MDSCGSRAERGFCSWHGCPRCRPTPRCPALPGVPPLPSMPSQSPPPRAARDALAVLPRHPSLPTLPILLVLLSLPQPTPHSDQPWLLLRPPRDGPGGATTCPTCAATPGPTLESSAALSPARPLAAVPDPPLPRAPRSRSLPGTEELRWLRLLPRRLREPGPPRRLLGLGSGKEETRGGPARPGGGRGDMGSAEEDYNFVFKGESRAPCQPSPSPKGVEQKSRGCGEGTRVRVPQGGCVLSWHVFG